jgi:hypothetical protein
MNKKIFGIKVSTYLTVLLCLVCAVTVWLFAKISPSLSAEVNAAMLHTVGLL